MNTRHKKLKFRFDFEQSNNLFLDVKIPKKDLLIVLPFSNQFSFKLRSRLYNCLNKTLPQYKVKVTFQYKSLSNLFRFKGSISRKLRSHLVYKFLCSNCRITYYDETERHLGVRYG